ncbi:MAG TPA: SRPBCC family protein [Geminicoccaceae bacterium]|nr:SRPBCC family protein [Geminicoccaceae bacterium]
MAEYERTLQVHADPDEIFRFVSDIRNLPKYLPTTRHAESAGRDRVRVEGEAHQHHYEADGFLRADPARHRLEWGADEGYYAGWLQIRPGDGAADVTVHLRFDSKPGGESGAVPSDADIEEGLEKGLRSIRNQLEGRGGKEEPEAAG